MTISERLANLLGTLDSIMGYEIMRDPIAGTLPQALNEARRLVGTLAEMRLDDAAQDRRNEIIGRLGEIEDSVNRLVIESNNEGLAKNVGFFQSWTSHINVAANNLLTASSVSMVLTTATLLTEIKGGSITKEYEKLNSSAKNLHDRLEKDINPRVASLQNDVDATREILDKKIQEMDDAIASVGVEKYKGEFGTTAKNHQWYGTAWLVVTIGAVFLTAAAPIILYNCLPMSAGPQGEWLTLDNINRSFIKLVVVFTLFFLVSQSIKNYRANRHLEIVNLHRSLALLTFKGFVESAGDSQDVRNAVLLETTRTIFTPSSTGYVPGENDGPDTKLIEILTMLRGK